MTAGLFVGSFLAKEIPWIHVDIAGTAIGLSDQRYHIYFSPRKKTKLYYFCPGVSLILHILWYPDSGSRLVI